MCSSFQPPFSLSFPFVVYMLEQSLAILREYTQSSGNRMNSKLNIQKTYSILYKHFGPQHWWPGDTPFEIAIGAILTQNTSWGNVERAIANLKAARVLSPRKLYALPEKKLAGLIRPSGYFNIKAKRLRAFLVLLCDEYRS